MTRVYRLLGRFYVYVGSVIMFVSIFLFLSSWGKLKIWTDFLGEFVESVFALDENPFKLMEPDTLVYDYTLEENVPRVYYLRIPKIQLEAPVVKVADRLVETDGEIVHQMYVPHAFAVGWDENSAPVGSSGNTVFVGHNNIYGEVFKGLWNLQSGDEIIVQTGSGDRHYSVSSVITLDESSLSIGQRMENASWIKWAPREQLTLVTCFPYSSNTHRLIVVAYPD